LPLTCPAQEDKRDSQPAAAGAAKPDAADSGDAKEEKADAGAKSALAGVPGMTQYIIGPEDVLFVKVWREPDLSGQMMVRPDGKISLPLVNEVEASGKTPEELAKHIASGLSKYMNQPEVSVMVQAVNSKFYFIQGEVLKPGKYPLLVPTTVLQALVNAGGFQEFANRKKIVVMRGDERHKFNYNDVIKGKKSDQNIVLHSGDLIVVP
jgi:polysaccharide export outer membrane protein